MLFACRNHKFGIMLLGKLTSRIFSNKTGFLRPFRWYEFTYSTESLVQAIPMGCYGCKLHLMMFNLGLFQHLIAFFYWHTNCTRDVFRPKFSSQKEFTTKNIDFDTHACPKNDCVLHPRRETFLLVS